MHSLKLSFKIFIGKLTLNWWTFRDEVLERILGDYVVHIYKLDERYSAGVVYKGKETIYHLVQASYGRERLYYWSKLLAKRHWYNKESPNLLMEYCPIAELFSNHAKYTDDFENAMANAERLNQITSKLNLAANKVTA